MDLSFANHNYNHNAVPLRVLLLHDDIFTCLRAWHVLDLVTRHLEKSNLPVQLGANVWKFENLSVPELGEQAINDSSNIDLLVLAAHGTQELPLPVKNWLQQWVSLSQSQERALVISLDSHVAESPLNFARQITQGTQVKVFPHWAGASLEFTGPSPWRHAPTESEPRKPEPGSRNSSAL